MYRPGDLQSVPKCDPALVEDYECDHIHPRDARGDYERLNGVVFLPHSCDLWVIGGPAEIDAMIADLLRARAALA